MLPRPSMTMGASVTFSGAGVVVDEAVGPMVVSKPEPDPDPDSAVVGATVDGAIAEYDLTIGVVANKMQRPSALRSTPKERQVVSRRQRSAQSWKGTWCSKYACYIGGKEEGVQIISIIMILCILHNIYNIMQYTNRPLGA